MSQFERKVRERIAVERKSDKARRRKYQPEILIAMFREEVLRQRKCCDLRTMVAPCITRIES